MTSDDIDAPTLGERPALHFAALRAATEPVAPRTPDDLHIRVRVPADQRAMFDELVAEARYGLRQRDDNVGVNLNWPAGLVRRAVLEAGRRLCDKALLGSPDHAIELSSDEIGPLLASGTDLTDTELAARAARRNHVEASGLPDVLGVPETLTGAARRSGTRDLCTGRRTSVGRSYNSSTGRTIRVRDPAFGDGRSPIATGIAGTRTDQLRRTR